MNNFMYTREEIMEYWDKWRRYISEGGKSSWPRDAFECVIDEFYIYMKLCVDKTELNEYIDMLIKKEQEALMNDDPRGNCAANHRGFIRSLKLVKKFINKR